MFLKAMSDIQCTVADKIEFHNVLNGDYSRITFNLLRSHKKLTVDDKF